MLECNIVVMHNFPSSIFGGENLWEPVVIRNSSIIIHKRMAKYKQYIRIESFRRVNFFLTIVASSTFNEAMINKIEESVKINLYNG